LIGGSKDRNLNQVTDEMVEWDLKTNAISYRAKMPFKQVDFSVLCTNDLKIYCVGGFMNMN